MPVNNIDLFFEENPNPMWIFEVESLQILHVNEAALSLYGYSEKEMLSLTIKDLRPEEDVPKLLESLEHEVQTFDDAGFWRHKTKEGQIIHVHISAHSIKVDGKKCELIAAKDVTQQIKTEARYKQSQKVLDLITSKLPGTFFIFKPNGTMLKWNNYVEEITEYSRKKISSMNALEFFSAEQQPIISEAIQEALDKGYVEVKSKLQSKSGTETPFFFKASTVQIDGQDRIIGIGIDISNLEEAQKEAKRHQKLLQAIIDQSEPVMYIKDKEGQFKFVNNAFLNLFDLDNKDKIIGKTDSEILPKKQAWQVQSNDNLAREKGKPIEIEEQIHIGGKDRTYLTIKSPLEGVEGYENCIFGYSTDITERKNNHQKLELALTEKETLLAEIHHRVKNNLAIISGLMGLQAMESSNEELQQSLKVSQSRIESIASIHELLYQQQDFSKIDFGNNIELLANRILESFDSDVDLQLRTKSIILNINQALPCSLIINELLTNAIKHAFEEEHVHPIIKIELEEQEDNVFLRISDNGRGLSDQVDIDEPDTLGMQLISTLKDQLNAELEITVSDGTTFELQFGREDVKGAGASFLEYSGT